MELYEQARRFDEGELYHSAEYGAVARQKEALRTLMRGRFGPEIDGYLDRYTAALYEEMELEAMHFFAEGVKAAKI